MDSSHAPTHSHTHSNHVRRPSGHIQSSEGEYDAAAAAAAVATANIEIPPSAGHSATTSAPVYDYHQSPTPSSPVPTKRSNESKPSPSKRIRTADPHDSASGPSSPSCTAPPSPATELLRSDCVAESPSRRTSPKPLVRSRSLPATFRRRRRTHDNPNQPPVTPSTLRELDLSEIYRNPKLRHDVVFDAQLHFRPNLDGSRGKRKREQADMYWKFVLAECDMFFSNARNRPQAAAGLAGVALKLPTLFKTMKDILSTLVPKSDREEVEAALDHTLLMQQLEHGVLDFKNLSEWLARVLKAHCAPMRDVWVEKMVARVAHGVETQNTEALVDGLKMVFGILEAMKLDVANHQIRTLRPHLVSTAVQFEQGYFQERIESGRLDMTEPRSWFQGALKRAGQGADAYATFTRSITEMLAPSKSAGFPATFTFDIERLEGIRDDIREATCLKLAMLFFRQLTLNPNSKRTRDMDAVTVETLRAQLLAILGEEEGPQRWIAGSRSVALHLAQAGHEFNGNTGLVDSNMVKVAEGWFERHLQFDSTLYKMVEQEIVKEVTALVLQVMKSWSSVSNAPIMQAADLTGSSVELTSISQRIAHIAFLHWRIFGKLYACA